jgi:squalene synthase HpnC
MKQPGDLTESAPPGFNTDEVMQKAAVENFSVASRLLPRRYREHLLAMYGFARFVDDIGDLAAGDRVAQLDWADAEIRRALNKSATHPVFVRAGASAIALDMGPESFIELIQANRQDQVVNRYATYAELLYYCSLSANPVGEMVLAVFGARTDETSERSDDVCTALQIIEHLQDLREDFVQGRIYLPTEDFVRFGVEEEDLGASFASAPLRSLAAFEAERARDLLQAGTPLVRLVHGPARVAISGFIGGGLAQLDAFRDAWFDVLARPVKASKSSMVRRSLGVYVRAFRPRQTTSMHSRGQR